MGTYEFNSSQVVSVNSYGSLPILSSGIRINHNRPDYPEKIIFWCIGNRSNVLKELAQSGFQPQGLPSERAAGFPIRWSILVAIIAIWNVLFLLDRLAQPETYIVGPLGLMALLLLFCTATGIRAFPRMQQMVLRAGHQIGEIKELLILLQIVTGFLTLVLSGVRLAHTYAG